MRNLIGLLEFHIAHSEILLTACADQLLYNLSLIKLCSACAIKNTSDAYSLLAKYTLSDPIGEPRRFINYQLWTSYKIFLNLKYLFHFFGWLHFFIRDRGVTVCYYHVTYAFQSKSAIYHYLNVKELLARNTCDIWILSVSNFMEIYPFRQNSITSSLCYVTCF